MHSTYPALFFLAIFTAGTALAQEDPGEDRHPCTLIPIYHCAEPLATGGAIGHFGYDLQCPSDLESIPDLDVPIGEDNHFSPEPADRGQPTIFVAGKHVDEFETEFTAEDIKQAKDRYWSVLKISASVDFSRTRDADLDCSQLAY